MVKKFWLGCFGIIIILTLILLGFIQYIFGPKRLFYDKGSQLWFFVELHKNEDWVGEMRIGRNLFHMDNVIVCNQQIETPIFFIIPRNDTLYIYDRYRDIRDISFKSIPFTYSKGVPVESWKVEGKIFERLGFEDSTLINNYSRMIQIDCDLSPIVFEKKDGTFIGVFPQRFF